MDSKEEVRSVWLLETETLNLFGKDAKKTEVRCQRSEVSNK